MKSYYKSMDSRSPFVKEVAKTITERHGKESGSFIFGISGKWGEGKTTFLDELKQNLEGKDSPFKVVDVNPWKFSVDRISFLRNFLRVLYESAGLNSKAALRDLDVDTSKSDIDWARFILFIINIAIVCFLFTQEPFFTFFTTLPSQWQFFFAVIIIPIFLALVQSVTVVEKTDHATATLDRFGDLFEDVLAKFKDAGKEPVVFVDDLDRVTPEMARDVLDNLRTFFDKKQVTFVVTGDHTVLESHLGRSLLPDEEPPAQLEEGRRFMKKIFNVYWRLPLPIKKELQDFIEEEFKKRGDSLSGIFSEEVDRKTFRTYLEKYFESNFRQIIRFLDKVIFNFQIIKQKAYEGDEQQAPFFKEMLEGRPLLVVRSLLIEELCAPLFDKMVRDVGILQKLEYAAEKKDTGKVSQLIEQSKAALSPSQRTFIEQFIYEEPRFYKELRLQVRNLQPYLSLAADASLGDERGPSGQDFIVTLNDGDPKRLTNDLVSMGDVKAQECAKALLSQLPSIAEEPKKLDAVKTLLIALNDSLPESPIHKIFATELAKLDVSFINNTSTNPKIEIVNLFWKWLDIVGLEVSEKFVDKFTIPNLADFGLLEVDGAGDFRSSASVQWLKTYYPQQKPDTLAAMVATLPKLKTAQVIARIEPMQAELVSDLINDGDAVARERRFIVLRDFTKTGLQNLKTQVFAKVSALDPQITQWALAKANEKDPPWSKADIETELLKRIDSAKDLNEVVQILKFLISNGVGTPESIWPRLLPKHETLLVDGMASIIDDASLQPVAPPQAYANQLLDAVVKKIKSVPPAEQSHWLGYIPRGKWLWVNLKKYPITTKFRTLKAAKSTSAEIKQLIKAAEESWEEKAKS